MGLSGNGIGALLMWGLLVTAGVGLMLVVISSFNKGDTDED